MVHLPKNIIINDDDNNNNNNNDNDNKDVDANVCHHHRDGSVFDSYLLGNCDDITRAIGKRLKEESNATITKNNKDKTNNNNSNNNSNNNNEKNCAIISSSRNCDATNRYSPQTPAAEVSDI